ncbi:MAG: hypothetical protein HYU36_02815 [Planctomycetes bacterium]|nr:hypothetical protein [Planctomycetota bacterium]
MAETPVLANRHLSAQFSPESGDLVHLGSTGRVRSLIERVGLWCLDQERRSWRSGHAGEKDAGSFRTLVFERRGDEVFTVSETRVARVARRFRLSPSSPLLEVSVRVTPAGTGGQLFLVGFPDVRFVPGFNNPFEDERDLYFDGAELGDGREIPCWRVFFRRGYAHGLLLATRTKRDMSRLTILADGFRMYPHLDLNYSTSLERSPMVLRPGKSYEVCFEIGPWSKARHGSLLEAARLADPVKTDSPPPKGSPKRRPRGRVFRGIEFAPARTMSPGFSRNRWHRAAMPWCLKGEGLFAGPGVRPPTLTLDPKLHGVYRIAVGIGHGIGVSLRLSGDPEWTFRVAGKESRRAEVFTPFSPFLSGRHQASEVAFRTARLDGRKLHLRRFPSLHAASVIDYVRFKKLSIAQVRRWECEESARPCIALSGFNDIPDIAPMTDASDPDPRAYASNIWEHANSKFDKIFWRIDGQCSDYPSKANTMRYVSARVHGVFDPQAKAYGRVLQKVDILETAVQAARKYGVKLYGWMRFNNYAGNVQSEFYRTHPEFWEEWEHGFSGNKLCLAFPEVRQHKIAILVEAASYGLDGLCLGFLRHPPVLLYHPVLVQGFRARHGVLPPRDPKAKDPLHWSTLPPDDESHTRWYQYRADFLTQFGRELRAALRDARLGHVPVTIWVRPNHCLFDGIDLDAWLEEGLCNEVVADAPFGQHATNPKCYDVKPEWKKRVQSIVPVVRGLPCTHLPWVRRRAKRYVAEGYDGLCTYESDVTVLESGFITFYRSLRR